MAENTLMQSAAYLDAGRWLLASGIQNRDENAPAYGGVNAWYNMIDGTYPFIYGEITGYAVNSYLHFYRQTGSPEYLDAAEKAAAWISAQRLQPSGLVLNRMNHSETANPYFQTWFFTFDQWMIVFGLAELAAVTGSSEHHKTAEEIAGFLIENTVQENGSFFPIFDQSTGKAVVQDDKWSRQAGGYHAKGLMGLLKLYDLTQESRYLETARSLQTWTLDSQQTTGRFITQDNERSSHLHPYLYTLEGLLYYASHQSCKETWDAAEKGARWILERQNERGGFFAYFINNQFRPFERVDIIAQAVRVAAILIQSGRLTEYTEQVAKAAQYLKGFQIQQGEQAGGLYYGQEEDGKVHYCVNAWVTMFAAQAFFYTDNLGKQKFDMSFFV